MPLEFVRQDITRMKCDAIVNPSNNYLMPGGSTDLAIHTAAGPELLAYCQTLDGCPTGSARISPAYNLPCKFVIHTAGPFWDDGKEAPTLLESCYKSCLKLAVENNCESVAFPLISSGTCGFPKDLVLKIAITVISDFLMQHEMMIYLVLFDKKSYEVGKKLFNVKEFIDQDYVYSHGGLDGKWCYLLEETGQAPTADCNTNVNPDFTGLPMDLLMERYSFSGENIQKKSYNPSGLESQEKHTNSKVVPLAFEEYIQMGPQGESFREILKRHLKAKRMKASDCYKKANVLKQTWSKIVSDDTYQPNKKTALSFCFALELSIDETQELLGSLGYTLSKRLEFDHIVTACLLNRIYNIHKVNWYLFEQLDQTLSSR